VIQLRVGDLIQLDLEEVDRQPWKHSYTAEEVGLVLAFIYEQDLRLKLKTKRVVQVLFGTAIINGKTEYFEEFFKVVKL